MLTKRKSPKKLTAFGFRAVSSKVHQALNMVDYCNFSEQQAKAHADQILLEETAALSRATDRSRRLSQASNRVAIGKSYIFQFTSQLNILFKNKALKYH